MHKIRVVTQKYARFRYCILPTAFCLLVVAYGLPSTAYCQSTGGIKGKLRNLNGEGIGGATVTARQNGKDLKSATSASKGDFQIDGLESGVYNVVFDAKGYSSGVKYDVPVQNGKIRDLGANLIMQVDRGSFVIVEGSVFFKSGHSIPGAEVKVERINGDGSLRKITTTYSNNSGEFGFRQKEGAAKFRITATYKGVSASKDIEVDSAAIYRLSIILDVERGDK